LRYTNPGGLYEFHIPLLLLIFILYCFRSSRCRIFSAFTQRTALPNLQRAKQCFFPDKSGASNELSKKKTLQAAHPQLIFPVMVWTLLSSPRSQRSEVGDQRAEGNATYHKVVCFEKLSQGTTDEALN
jgi:hypothetical protein